jgi:hypothetical protein
MGAVLGIHHHGLHSDQFVLHLLNIILERPQKLDPFLGGLPKHASHTLHNSSGNHLSTPTHGYSLQTLISLALTATLALFLLCPREIELVYG